MKRIYKVIINIKNKFKVLYLTKYQKSHAKRRNHELNAIVIYSNLFKKIKLFIHF